MIKSFLVQVYKRK